MSEIAKITLEGKEFEFPVITGSEGEKAIDISTLRSKTAHITLDPGYKNTGSTTSEITFLDGEKGILRYRGYPIEQLAEKASFLEVAYLLIHGELPNASELDYFTESITYINGRSKVPEILATLQRSSRLISFLTGVQNSLFV
jgi:citrate synthase